MCDINRLAIAVFSTMDSSGPEVKTKSQTTRNDKIPNEWVSAVWCFRYSHSSSNNIFRNETTKCHFVDICRSTNENRGYICIYIKRCFVYMSTSYRIYIISMQFYLWFYPQDFHFSCDEHTHRMCYTYLCLCVRCVYLELIVPTTKYKKR